MSGSQFRIAVDLSDLMPEGSALTADAFPALSYAVKRIAAAAHEQWVAYAHGAPLPSGDTINSRSGTYARSIQVADLGDFSSEIFSVLPYAKAIEEGTPARDLKDMLRTSLKVRLTKDGRRYLIVPFRHDNPNSLQNNPMPQPVADWWKDKSRASSHITGDFQRLSGTGAFDRKTRQAITTPGRLYSWGSKLGKTDLAGMGIHGKEAKRLAGMVQFRNPSGGHTQHLTFRVMVEGGKGWLAPAQAGKWPARTTADLFRPIAEEAFPAAVAQDIQRLLGGS